MKMNAFPFPQECEEIAIQLTGGTAGLGGGLLLVVAHPLHYLHVWLRERHRTGSDLCQGLCHCDLLGCHTSACPQGGNFIWKGTARASSLVPHFWRQVAASEAPRVRCAKLSSILEVNEEEALRERVEGHVIDADVAVRKPQ
eukprot:TRINITY_DN659_c0_g5_i1.p1 TRINITY_DN659_c0_g5~~TRINITY_DN659_c0_g5_i1.p1  ORF type:complete len:142 (+),score=5.13 TRINITY_DN659_c0_g5_i1:482-907(+)